MFLSMSIKINSGSITNELTFVMQVNNLCINYQMMWNKGILANLVHVRFDSNATFSHIWLLNKTTENVGLEYWNPACLPVTNAS